MRKFYVVIEEDDNLQNSFTVGETSVKILRSTTRSSTHIQTVWVGQKQQTVDAKKTPIMSTVLITTAYTLYSVAFLNNNLLLMD